MSLLERIKDTVVAAPGFILYTTIGSLPLQGLQTKAFERLSGSWSRKVRPDYHQLEAYIVHETGASVQELLPESLEQRLASENKKRALGAALRYTTVSAAIEFVAGIGLVLPTAVTPSYANLVTLGGILLLGDAGFRLLIRKGESSDAQCRPAGLCEGLVEFVRFGVYGVRAAFDKKDPSTS